jgi:5S rRNA maturation endonuclease (ribonuclease M5)
MSSAILTFEDWVLALNKSEKIIIVEGKKDSLALIAVGVRNKIFALNKKPLFSVVEEVAASAKDVVILTDLDRTGRQIYGKLSHGLQQHGVNVDNKFREFLFRKTLLRQIEGLLSHFPACVDENI